jgi:hypothetical protein
MIGVVVRVTNREKTQKLADALMRDGNGIQGKTRRLVGIYGLKIEREAKRAVGVVTNTLRSSITMQLEGSGTTAAARVGTNVKHAPHVNYGTGLWGPKKSKYEIRPKNAKALAWATPVGREFRLTSGGQPVLGRNLYQKSKVGLRMESFRPGQRPAAFKLGAGGALGKALFRGRIASGGVTARGWDRSIVAADSFAMVVHHPGSPGQFFLCGAPTAPFERNAPLFRADLATMLRNLGRV